MATFIPIGTSPVPTESELDRRARELSAKADKYARSGGVAIPAAPHNGLPTLGLVTSGGGDFDTQTTSAELASRNSLPRAILVDRNLPTQRVVVLRTERQVGVELQIQVIHRVAQEVAKAKKTQFNYIVGTMIEVPRGALTADEIAAHAQFFSFGTNDLTQTTLGMSRDDSGSFLPAYQELDIVKANPFASIDQTGVGRLMEIAVQRGRNARPEIKLGICGEHGGGRALKVRKTWELYHVLNTRKFDNHDDCHGFLKERQLC